MKVKKTKLDKIFNLLSLLLLIGTTLFFVLHWSNFPDKVPMHYDAAGHIDRWGNKQELLILPLISWIMYLFMTIIEQLPQLWNTGVRITDENKERVYRTLLHLMTSIKFIIISLVSYMSLQSALSHSLPVNFTIVTLLLVFGDILFWSFRLLRIR